MTLGWGDLQGHPGLGDSSRLGRNMCHSTRRDSGDFSLPLMHQQEPGTISSDVDKILVLMKRNKERGRDLILRSEASSLKSEVKTRDNPEFGGDLIYKGNGFSVKKKDCSV